MSDPIRPTRLVHVEQIVFEHPWAIKPNYLDAIAEIVEVNVRGGHLQFEAQERRPTSGVVEIRDGMAVVPIRGVLMRRANMFQQISGAMSVGQIQKSLDEAFASEAKTVLLDIDSPGGEVIGIGETADMIWEGRRSSGKMVIAFTDHLMASAAYWLGSQADLVISTPDAEVGSIGIVAKLLDTSRMERNIGLDSHILKSGEFKAIGAGPVTERQLDILREMRDQMFEKFTGAVERGRGAKLDEEVLTGRTFLGEDAMRVRLVDETMTYAQLARKYGS